MLRLGFPLMPLMTCPMDMLPGLTTLTSQVYSHCSALLHLSWSPAYVNAAVSHNFRDVDPEGLQTEGSKVCAASSFAGM